MDKFIIVIAIIIAINIVVSIVYLYTHPTAVVVGLNVLANIRKGIHQEIVTIEDQQWIYNTAGSGEILLLLHGFGGHKESWNELLPHLSQDYAIIAVDLPGFGESSKDFDDDYSINSQVLRLHAFITRLGLTSFHLAGHSMGGAIAGAYAATYPSNINSLWLLNPAGIQSAQNSEFDIALQDTGENILIPQTLAEFEQQLAWLYHTPPVQPNYIKRGMFGLMGETSFVNKLHRDLTRNWEPLEEILAGYTGQVLITWGEDDRLTDVSGAAILDKLLPHPTVHLLAQTGHLPMLEQPKQTATEFLHFNQRF